MEIISCEWHEVEVLFIDYQSHKDRSNACDQIIETSSHRDDHVILDELGLCSDCIQIMLTRLQYLLFTWIFCCFSTQYLTVVTTFTPPLPTRLAHDEHHNRTPPSTNTESKPAMFRWHYLPKRKRGLVPWKYDCVCYRCHSLCDLAQHLLDYPSRIEMSTYRHCQLFQCQ